VATALALPLFQPIPTPVRAPRLWTPKRVLVTRSARQFTLTNEIVSRAAALGSEIIELNSDRLGRIAGNDTRKAYAEAKSTMALVVAPPSSFKLRPIPPSADWQFHIAQGCPAHCQYCYLAGSLTGPPLTRVYANLDAILDNLKGYAGSGMTTFECSCYTDPLALEHLTGALAQSIRFFGNWQAPVQLRWTTKFDNVETLLNLPHHRRTRIRFSINADPVSRNFEGGTASVSARLEALRRVAKTGYPVGLTIAPIMDVPDFENVYGDLLKRVAAALDGIAGVDLTAELITHRFTPTSKEVLLNWYPRTPLDMNEPTRAKKHTKFGTFKYVYPLNRMKQMRSTLETLIARTLPETKILYWT
jgi:spore photoproduct lyase